MPQIQFLTPDQEALIPEYQEKWKRIYLSTEPIDRIRAAAAVKGAYAVMGKKEPEVIFCSSPRAALERLQENISQVEIPQDNVRVSPEEVQSNFFKFFVQGVWETIKIQLKQQHAGTKPIHDLLKDVAHDASKSLGKHVDHLLPKDLTTQEIVEQAVLGSSPLFETLGKQMAHQGDAEFSRTLQDRQPEDWQETFVSTASAVETQLAWLPAKGLFFRKWLKQMLQSTLTAKICGLEHPRFRDLISVSLSLSEKKFLVENPPVIISDFAIYCTWSDFAFSVLNFAHRAKKWAALQGLVKHCGWIFAVDNLCIVCDRPTRILVDDDNQLHGEGEPALQFADGSVAYAYHGVPLPEKYGTAHSSQWQAQWVLEERSENLQQALIQAIGAVRLCQELPAVELDTRQNYTLLKLENVEVRDTHILKRLDSETDAIYAVFVPWRIKSVRSAIQYVNQNLSPEDFPMPNDEA